MIDGIKTQTWKIMFRSVGRQKENKVKLIKYTKIENFLKTKIE